MLLEVPVVRLPDRPKPSPNVVSEDCVSPDTKEVLRSDIPFLSKPDQTLRKALQQSVNLLRVLTLVGDDIYVIGMLPRGGRGFENLNEILVLRQRT